MKGTILDFLKLATEKPELAKDLVELARRFDFEFTDEVSDEALDSVAGGLSVGLNFLSTVSKSSGGTTSAFPDVCQTPTPAGPVPIPYPNVGAATDGDGTSTKGTTKTNG